MNAFDFVLLTMKSNIRADCSDIYKNKKKIKQTTVKVGLGKIWLKTKKLQVFGGFSGIWVFSEAMGSNSSYNGHQMAVWDQSFVCRQVGCGGKWW